MPSPIAKHSYERNSQASMVWGDRRWLKGAFHGFSSANGCWAGVSTFIDFFLQHHVTPNTFPDPSPITIKHLFCHSLGPQGAGMVMAVRDSQELEQLPLLYSPINQSPALTYSHISSTNNSCNHARLCLSFPRPSPSHPNSPSHGTRA